MQKTHVVLFVAFIFAFILGASACGEGDDSTDGEDNISQLGVELTEAHCNKIFSCCSESERVAAFQGIPVSTQEECISSVEGIVQINVVPRYEDAVANGTIDYSGAVENCITGYSRLACDDFQPDPRLALIEVPECAALFEPQLETTEFCTDDFECKSGFCAISGEMGTCAELPGEMEACVAGSCQESLYCREGMCVPRLDDGAECDVSTQCTSRNCVDVSDNGSGDLRCRPLPAACGG